MVMTRYGGLSKTHWQKYRRGYALETKLGGNSLGMNVRDPLGLRFDPSCVLYLPLGKKDASSFMSSDAYGHLATVTGALWTPQGRSLDGDDYINCGNGTALRIFGSSFTILMWVKTSTIVNNAGLFVRSGADGAQFVMSSLGKQRAIVTGGFSQNANTVFADGNWHLLTETYDTANSNTISWFLDAIADGSSASQTFAAGTTEDYYVGTERTAAVFLTGTIGEVLIYSRALSASEIQNIYLSTRWRYQ